LRFTRGLYERARVEFPFRTEFKIYNVSREETRATIDYNRMSTNKGQLVFGQRRKNVIAPLLTEAVIRTD